MKRVFLFLVVVAVIVAAVWISRSVNSWRVNARTVKFNTDIENFFSGLQKYKEHVGTYPTGSNSEIVKALLGQNPKKPIILVGRKNELNDKGEFVDPWGTPLKVYFSDQDILVRSAGMNRRFDDSTVPENDDYFRSN